MTDNDHIPATRYRLKRVDTYEIPVSDFNRIKSEACNVGSDLQFAIALIPLAIGLSLTLATVPIPKDQERTFQVIVILTAVSWVLGLFFSYRAFLSRGAFDRLMEDLRSQQVGPLGSEGKELELSELANLPAEAAQPSQMPLEDRASAGAQVREGNL